MRGSRFGVKPYFLNSPIPFYLSLVTIFYPLCHEPCALRLMRVSRLISSNHCPSIFDGFANVLLQPMARHFSCPFPFSGSNDYFCAALCAMRPEPYALCVCQGLFPQFPALPIPYTLCRIPYTFLSPILFSPGKKTAKL